MQFHLWNPQMCKSFSIPNLRVGFYATARVACEEQGIPGHSYETILHLEKHYFSVSFFNHFCIETSIHFCIGYTKTNSWVFDFQIRTRSILKHWYFWDFHIAVVACKILRKLIFQEKRFSKIRDRNLVSVSRLSIFMFRKQVESETIFSEKPVPNYFSRFLFS